MKLTSLITLQDDQQVQNISYSLIIDLIKLLYKEKLTIHIHSQSLAK